MPVRFTTQKSIGRKGMGESIEGTGQAYDVSVVDYAKAITLGIGLMLDTKFQRRDNNLVIYPEVRCNG